MYLKHLYRHNKLLCIAITLLVLAQLINNIRQDIAISPLYSYGMYSEIIKPDSIYTIPEIFVNGARLRTRDYTPLQWENIALPVNMFYEQQQWNLNVWQTDIKRLLPFADSVHFVNTLTENEFKDWYRQHLQTVLNTQIQTLNIDFTAYSFDGQQLHQTKN